MSAGARGVRSPRRYRASETRSRVTEITPAVRRVLAEATAPMSAAQITEAIHGPDYPAFRLWDVEGALEWQHVYRVYSPELGRNLYSLAPLAP